MPGFQSPITVKQALDRINARELLLPAFQREFVWSREQIQNLFDSLMKKYPFSSMLFWNIKDPDNKKQHRFYPFVSDFRQLYQTFESQFSTENHKDFNAVLDGQQRLTALYIGFRGSYADKEPRKKWENTEESLPTRKLYLNLTQKTIEAKYEFVFYTSRESENFKDIFKKENNHWFRVGYIEQIANILDFSQEHREKLSQDEIKAVYSLKQILDENIINFYQIDTTSYQEAVDIFIRINSGGTTLSNADILFSMVIAHWEKVDAKKEFNDLIQEIKNLGFSIDNNYIIKSFLFLYHREIPFNLTTFSNDFLSKMEKVWVDIRKAIKELYNLLYDYSLDSRTLTSNTATLPILYHIYHRNIYIDFYKKIQYKAERQKIQKWLLAMLVKQAFGGSSDTALNQARQAFTQDVSNKFFTQDAQEDFPDAQINSSMKKGLDIGDNFISALLETQKDDKYAFSILALLYPHIDYTNHSFHKDHLHPQNSFNKDKHNWDIYNSILNLQLLDENENKSKQDIPLAKWINSCCEDPINRKSFMERQSIPDVDLSLEKFDEFIEARKTLLIDKFKEILKI